MDIYGTRPGGFTTSKTRLEPLLVSARPPPIRSLSPTSPYILSAEGLVLSPGTSELGGRRTPNGMARHGSTRSPNYRQVETKAGVKEGTPRQHLKGSEIASNRLDRRRILFLGAGTSRYLDHWVGPCVRPCRLPEFCRMHSHLNGGSHPIAHISTSGR